MGLVRSIYDALVSEVSDELGTDWTQLQNFLENIEANTSRNIVKGFGVIPGQAIPTAGVVRFMTLDQQFSIVLTDKNTREINDTERVDALLDRLYDRGEAVLVRILNQQLGLAGTVLSVSTPSMADPIYLDSYIVLNLSVVVKYRRQL